MPSDGKLLAWTEPHGDAVLAAFVSAHTPDRPPATCLCTDRKQGWLWVEAQAAAIGGVTVEWVSPP
jgi:hypothetical protein